MRIHSEYHAECDCGEPVVRHTANPFDCPKCGRRCEIRWNDGDYEREPEPKTISEQEEAA